MNALDPFGRGAAKAKASLTGETDAAVREPQFVVQRTEDGKLLGIDGRPTSNLADAEIHDSRAIASLWADRASKSKLGNWEAVPRPGPEDDLDPDPDAAYARLSKKAA